MPRHPAHEKLKACPIFRDFDDAELAALLELAEPTVHAPGHCIVKQGDSGNSMFLIADGTAEITMHTDAESTIVLSRIGPGDFFGELAVVDHEPRSADVTVLDECTVLKITMSLMKMFAVESPSAAFKLAVAVLEVVGRRLRASNRRYTDSLAIVSALASEGTVMERPPSPGVVV
jgi:CRP-like cAMP-binding protein